MAPERTLAQAGDCIRVTNHNMTAFRPLLHVVTRSETLGKLGRTGCDVPVLLWDLRGQKVDVVQDRGTVPTCLECVVAVVGEEDEE